MLSPNVLQNRSKAACFLFGGAAHYCAAFMACQQNRQAILAASIMTVETVLNERVDSWKKTGLAVTAFAIGYLSAIHHFSFIPIQAQLVGAALSFFAAPETARKLLYTAGLSLLFQREIQLSRVARIVYFVSSSVFVYCGTFFANQYCVKAIRTRILRRIPVYPSEIEHLFRSPVRMRADQNEWGCLFINYQLRYILPRQVEMTPLKVGIIAIFCGFSYFSPRDIPLFLGSFMAPALNIRILEPLSFLSHYGLLIIGAVAHQILTQNS